MHVLIQDTINILFAHLYDGLKVAIHSSGAIFSKMVKINCYDLQWDKTKQIIVILNKCICWSLSLFTYVHI